MPRALYNGARGINHCPAEVDAGKLGQDRYLDTLRESPERPNWRNWRAPGSVARVIVWPFFATVDINERLRCRPL
jgi:hypothetical protein